MAHELWGRHNQPYDAIYAFSIKGVSVFGIHTEQCLNLINDALSAPIDAADISSCPQVIEVSDGNTLLAGNKITNDQELPLAAIWADVTGEDQARCHIPHHGIATMKNGQLDWFAAICFTCDNVSIVGPAAKEKWRKLTVYDPALRRTCEFKNMIEALHGGEFYDRASRQKGPTEW